MERLQDKRVWLGGGAIVALLIIAVAWFIFIDPELSSASDLRSQEAATRQQNSVLQVKVKSLQAKSTHLSTYTKSLNAALLALPFDSGLPAFTRQLSAQAKADNVTISSIAVGGVTPATAGATTATAPGTDTTGSTATTPTATPTTAGAATSAAGTLFSIQVTVLSTGSLTDQLAFINDIRVTGPRRALLTSTQFAAGVGAKTASIDGSAALTTQLTIFSAPQSPVQIAQLKKLLSGKIGN